MNSITLRNFFTLLRIVIDESQRCLSKETIVYHKLEAINLDEGKVYYRYVGCFRVVIENIEEVIKDKDTMEGFSREEMYEIFMHHFRYIKMKYALEKNKNE
jgi:hypothetical protein